jgi:predicted dehydrogenase
LHESQAVEAFEGGCNVLVEKPTTLSVRGFDRMMEASERAGRRLFLVHNSLFNPGVRKARSWIQSGKLGRITDLEIAYLNTSHTMDGWLLKKEHWVHSLPGGIITETLPHPIYLAQSLVGSLNVLAVAARKVCSLSWVLADDVRALLSSKECQVMIHVSYNFPRSARAISVGGERAVVSVDLETGLAELLGSRSDRPLALGTDYLQRSAHMLKHAARESLVRSPTGHYTLFANAVECLLHDAHPLVSLEAAREVVRLCEEIYSRYEMGNPSASLTAA